MPAEWAPHQACLMEWPTQTRAQLWGELLDEAKRDYATVARAIAAFEPVIMVADPAQAGEAHDHCGSGIEILPVPIDDSWMRDNGPIFVADPRGRLALVHFRFNSWGERYLPYDRDALVPAAIAAHLGVRRYAAPFVLEGGSTFVDGEGTLLTTEQCLLNPNRNPALSAPTSSGGCVTTSAPRVVVVARAGALRRPGHRRPHRRDRAVRRARRGDDPRARRAGRPRPRQRPGQRPPGGGGRCARPAPRGDRVRFPVTGRDLVPELLPAERRRGGPRRRLAGGRRRPGQIAAVFGDREIVPVPGRTLNEGGGGPHCITQQVPAGTLVHL